MGPEPAMNEALPPRSADAIQDRASGNVQPSDKGLHMRSLYRSSARAVLFVAGAAMLVLGVSGAAQAHERRHDWHYGRHYDWHHGRHHDWHWGRHRGLHDRYHWDRRHGWHWGRHYGWHRGRHHDWHRGRHYGSHYRRHHDWY
jgi:hypothetical protein